MFKVKLYKINSTLESGLLTVLCHMHFHGLLCDDAQGVGYLMGIPEMALADAHSVLVACQF